VLSDAQRVARRDVQHLLHEIEPRHHLGHWVLNLKPTEVVETLGAAVAAEEALLLVAMVVAAAAVVQEVARGRRSRPRRWW
jgi:hypothetical protein